MFIKKYWRVIIPAVGVVFLFYVSLSTGKMHHVPLVGKYLQGWYYLYQSKQADSGSIDQLRLKAMSEAVLNGKTEYQYEAPTLLGPK